MTTNSKLIVTTPNCYSYNSIMPILFNQEKIHPEHLLQHSKQTLIKFLLTKNLKIEYFDYCMYNSYRNASIKKKILYFLLKPFLFYLYPQLFIIASNNEIDNQPVVNSVEEY